MAKLSYINTGVKNKPDLKFNIPTDESVGAILFDISGFSEPFKSYPFLYNNFKDNAIKLINNMEDAGLIGIKNDGFLNGVLYYHLSEFYNYVGKNQQLYVVIADCSNGWDVLWNMQQNVNGKLFQIGVWTTQPIWKRNADGSIGFTTLITDLQKQADEINGKVNKITSSMTPLNIILSGNSKYIGEDNNFTFKSLPDATVLDCPKVSVILAQNGTKEVHDMQNKNPNKAPVSAIGKVMACLALCGAEESVAAVNKCDLNKNEGFNYPELGVGMNNAPLKDMHRMWCSFVSSLGYIMPINYEGIEASYFLSSDQTLCFGDFSTIANNRVMHKCRRAACTALIPYTNSNHIYNPGTKTISETSMSMIRDSINTILDSVMINKLGKNQINGRQLFFIEDNDILETDSIAMKLKIKPANYSSFISEEVSHTMM